MTSALRKLYSKVVPETDGILYYLPRLLGANCKSLIDFGCGYNSPVRVLPKDMHKVGIEVFHEYAERARINKTHDKIIEDDLLSVALAPKSFDAALALDVIEHLSKEDGFKLIAKMQMVAKQKVLILTPNGYFAQSEYDSNEHQEHKSGWTIEDFKALGFSVYGCYGNKKHNGLLAGISEPKYKRLLADLSQRNVFTQPEKAFSIVAVLDIK